MQSYIDYIERNRLDEWWMDSESFVEFARAFVQDFDAVPRNDVCLAGCRIRVYSYN